MPLSASYSTQEKFLSISVKQILNTVFVGLYVCSFFGYEFLLSHMLPGSSSLNVKINSFSA